MLPDQDACLRAVRPRLTVCIINNGPASIAPGGGVLSQAQARGSRVRPSVARPGSAIELARLVGRSEPREPAAPIGVGLDRSEARLASTRLATPEVKATERVDGIFRVERDKAAKCGILPGINHFIS